ncbi:MAG: hypothetical protein HYX90_07980 [Chloroflexi bacterium]|nr:hypothetical protein [Chloroflexota bacterium]
MPEPAPFGQPGDGPRCQGEQGAAVGRGDAEAVRHLWRKLESGAPWHIALLEAIGLWCSPAELYHGRRYRYLIGDEAFDWLLLAERLLGEVKGLVPEEEANLLLFSGKLPGEITREQFRNAIGPVKSQAHLNYVYGVVVEEALLMAVEEEVQKERSIMVFEGKDVTEEAFLRVYGATRKALLSRFQAEKGMPSSRSMTLAEVKEFTYWLFKYRLATTDPERVASDTRKALQQVERAGGQNLFL